MMMSPPLWTQGSMWVVLGAAFSAAMALGALLAATRYCSLGAVSDWWLIGDTHRLRMWLGAMGAALLGTAGLIAAGVLDPAATLVPYASAHFSWMRYFMGGLVFGMGMQLASGCASRQLLRLGGGSLKASTSLAVAACVAAWLVDGGGYRQYLSPLLDVGAIELAPDQRLGSLLGAGGDEDLVHLALATGLGLALLRCARGPRYARLQGREWAAGLGLGLTVVFGWWLSGGAPGRLWQDEMALLEAIPRGVGTQSYTFVAPLTDLIACLRGRAAPTFGLCGALGLVGGSLLWHWRTGRLRLERHRDLRDWLRSVCGGALLGAGGVTALGCTIGQGVTGVSTLALGSLLATAATVLGVTFALLVDYQLSAAR